MTSNSDVYKPSPGEELLAIDYEINEIDAAIQKLKEKKKVLLQKRQAVKDEVLLQKSQSLAKQSWDEERFPWSKELSSKLQNTFKISTFRPFQLATMNAALSKEDVILIMPTGGGKSLCYQLPALVSEGVTVVVCPLIALMEDQIMGLKKLNVAAEMISSATPAKQLTMILTAMVDKKAPMKLLYVTPERMAKSKRFMTKLQKMYTMKRLSLIAIDEVHCCSQWGHDFRPDYKFLGVLKGMFPDVPILGLTATATSKVIVDVQKMLNIQGCLVLKATFNRRNLYYEVRIKPNSQADCISQLEDLLKRKYAHQSGIIYTTSIKECEEIMKGLRERGIALGMYHANLDSELRSKVHLKWLNGSYQAVVATIAFGLGIDKPDVRFVIHHCLSKSMENFYQESGRAGRDDKPADCVLFYRLSDVFKLSTMVFSQQTGLENLYGILAYCLDSDKCRRSIIASHFGEAWEADDCKAMCDHCRRRCEPKEVDIGNYCRSLYQIIQNAAGADIKLTAQMLIDAWLGKGKANLRVNTVPVPKLDREICENIIGHLLVEGYFREDFHFTPYSTISYIIRGPRAAIVSNGAHKIIMKVKGKSLPTNVVSKSKESEKSPSKESVGRKLKDSKDVERDTQNTISIEKVNKPSQSGTRGENTAKSGFKNSVLNLATDSTQCNERKKPLKRTADEINLCSDSDNEKPVVSEKKRKHIVIDSDSSSSDFII